MWTFASTEYGMHQTMHFTPATVNSPTTIWLCVNKPTTTFKKSHAMEYSCQLGYNMKPSNIASCFIFYVDCFKKLFIDSNSPEWVDWMKINLSRNLSLIASIEFIGFCSFEIARQISLEQSESWMKSTITTPSKKEAGNDFSISSWK